MVGPARLERATLSLEGRSSVLFDPETDTYNQLLSAPMAVYLLNSVVLPHYKIYYTGLNRPASLPSEVDQNRTFECNLASRRPSAVFGGVTRLRNWQDRGVRECVPLNVIRTCKARHHWRFQNGQARRHLDLLTLRAGRRYPPRCRTRYGRRCDALRIASPSNPAVGIHHQVLTPGVPSRYRKSQCRRQLGRKNKRSTGLGVRG